MFDEHGELNWEADYDIYGKIRKLYVGSLGDCPFRYQGQYEDVETGLYYNRFRYYSPDAGTYVSQDPIGLAGGMPNFYSYVPDCNLQGDIFGLIVNNLVRYKPNTITPKPGSRGTAINRAWKEEQALINRTGKGTRDWTPQEIGIIKNGKSGKGLTSVMSNNGYTGHHINNVSDFPELKGDPRNIVFLKNANHPSGYDEHLYSNTGHRGNYDTRSNGRLIDRNLCH